MRCLILLLCASPALAQGDFDDLEQPGDDLPVEGAIRGRNSRPGSVSVEVAEVRAGPGEAYVSRGRAYKGDPVMVSRRNEAGDWVEVDAGGLRGWVRVGDVRLAGEGPQDAGRDRRQTNYRYDEKGRRIRSDGEAAGSGEGTEGSEEDDVEVSPEPDPEAGHLRLTLVLGAGKIGRDFTSDAETESILDQLSASGSGLSTTIAAEWMPKRWLAVRGLFRDSRFASVQLPAQPDAGFEEAVELAVDAQQLEVDAVGGYPLGPVWLGGYGGARMLRHAFQQTAPFPVFLTDTYLGLGLGARVRASFQAVEITAEGGLVLPLSTSQDPQDSGAPDASGLEARIEVGYALTDAFALVGQGYFTEITGEFKGVSQHRDTVKELGYTSAKSVDGVLGGGLGVRWTAF